MISDVLIKRAVLGHCRSAGTTFDMFRGMKTKLTILILLVLSANVTLGEEVMQVTDANATKATQTVEPLTTVKSEVKSVDDYKNYFGNRLMVYGGGDYGLSYSRRFTPNFALGLMVALGGYSNTKEGGSLDQAQYYKDEQRRQQSMVELDGIYYFRENGFKRWGFLTRAGVGYADRKVDATWIRYDRDPGWFNIGDDKRERERKEMTFDWSTGFARVGGYYQFAWMRSRPGALAGQILEVGASAFMPFKPGSFEYTKPNGNVFREQENSVIPTLEVVYSLVF